jgi:hypothetical protein
MPDLRSILARLLGRSTGTIIVPPTIDEATLAALANGELAPPFPHDAKAGTTCAIGWHVRRMSIADGFELLRSPADGGRHKSWFRLPPRSRRAEVTPATEGELFRFAAVLPDGVPTRATPWFCDGCGRAVGA